MVPKGYKHAMLCRLQPDHEQAITPLECGCFPATPVFSVSATRRTPHAPVWVDLGLIQLLCSIQHRSKTQPSDYAFASGLAAHHAAVVAEPAKHSCVAVVPMSAAVLRKHISAAVQQYRYVLAQIHSMVEDVAHPKEQAGSALRECHVCATGTNPDLPLQLHGDSVPSPSDEKLAFPPGVTTRPASVRPAVIAQHASLLCKRSRSHLHVCLHGSRAPNSWLCPLVQWSVCRLVSTAS